MPVLRWIIPAVFAVLIWTGCSGPQIADAPGDMPGGFPNHSSAEIIEHLNRDAESLQSFQADARLTFESPDQSGRFSAEVQHRRNDSLFLSLSPGLGIEAARALVTPDSFYVYERINRRLTYGAIQDAGAHLPRPLVQGQLMDNLLGLVAPSPDEDWTVTADTLHYQFTAPDESEVYVVDPSHWRVVRYESRSPDGSLREERTYSDFGSFGNTTLPRSVIINLPEERSHVAVAYRNIDLNPDELTFDLRADNASERVLISSTSR